MSDVIIIGYGPAGVSASLYALRSGLDVVLVGKDSGALEKAHMIENYYGLERPLSGSDLFAVGKAQAARLGAQIVDDEVTDLYFDGKMFVATGLSGEYRGRAKAVVLGCTHYPFVERQIREILGDVDIYNGAEGVARELMRNLDERDLRGLSPEADIIFESSDGRTETTDFYRRMLEL